MSSSRASTRWRRFSSTFLRMDRNTGTLPSGSMTKSRVTKAEMVSMNAGSLKVRRAALDERNGRISAIL